MGEDRIVGGIEMMLAFLIFQACVVLFIAAHDWLPLGRLSNRAGVRSADSTVRLLVTTALSVLPFAAGFAGSVAHATRPFPPWLSWLLVISYGMGFYGMLRAWYLPYFFYRDEARVRRYQQRFAGTHAFLPMRNGIRPDTLHVTFHAVLIITVGLLCALVTTDRLEW
jgi:hypothetical protein